MTSPQINQPEAHSKARLRPTFMMSSSTAIAFWLNLIVFGLSTLFAMAEPQADAPAESAIRRSPLIPEDPNYPPPKSLVAATLDELGKQQSIQILGPGKFKLGDVLLDQSSRSISFPAELNQREGPLEYLLVTKGGKLHESLFRTTVKPYEIHVAMLLLGAKGLEGMMAEMKQAPQAPEGGATITEPSKRKIPGDPMSLSVEWTQEVQGKRQTPVELLAQPESNSEYGGGPWVYNGSSTYGGVFHAELGGSIVSLITDSLALVNYTGEGHEDDEIWKPRTEALPEVGTPLRITFQLQSPN